MAPPLAVLALARPMYPPKELSGRVTDRDLPVAFAPHPNPVRLAASACSALEPARRARIFEPPKGSAPGYH